MAASVHWGVAQRPRLGRSCPHHDAEGTPASRGRRSIAQHAQPQDYKYTQMDDSTRLAHAAKQQFARAIQGGEPRMRLAEAALWASAEEDAIASSSTVPFPVDAYLQRIRGVTAHARQQLAAAGLLPPGDGGRGAAPDPARVVEVVERAVLAQPLPRPGQAGARGVSSLGFRAPEHGRSALPRRVVVDHAGTWEVARDALLHEVLIRRAGHPAALAILLAQVMSELLHEGSVAFAATVDFGDFDDPPQLVPLPGLGPVFLQRLHGRAAAGTWDGDAGAASGGGGAAAARATATALNTCSSEVLVELQRHLKRAYWPWPWDSRVDAYEEGGANSLGGFRAACKAVATNEEASSTWTAISTVAAMRLARGVFTSPGAGDARRARAACERLVLLRGQEQPEERRDLAVLLAHAGEWAQARAELQEYLSSAAARRADPMDQALCQQLMRLLEAACRDAQLPPARPLSVEAVLESDAVQEAPSRPLIW